LSTKIILYGASRGAATAFQAFADMDSQGTADDIAAVVCEGIFDSVPALMPNVSFINKAKIGLLMYAALTRFKKDGPSPIGAIEKIRSKNIPIAIITSRADQEVPYCNTKALYDALIANGHQHVHMLTLEKASHSRYALDDEKETYQAFVHAFYKRYELPYIQEFADQGENLLGD
jgi:hypothetical protein